MRILHVVNISFVIPFFLGKQLAYFSSKGYKEYVVCSPSDELEEFSRNYEFENHPIGIYRKFSLISDFKAIYHVYRLIKREKIDVVNGHTPKGALIAMIASYIARVSKRIYFRHGLFYETSTGAKWYILKRIGHPEWIISILRAFVIILMNENMYQFFAFNGICV